MRIKHTSEEESEIMLSPLIDCVFLLLIFFLVTTMLKKWEKQIPVTMPDITSSISATANEDIAIIAIDRHGQLHRQKDKDRDGFIKYAPIDDLAVFLKTLSESRSPSRPLRIMADRRTPFQRVITMLDICQLQGFHNVDLKLKHDRY